MNKPINPALARIQQIKSRAGSGGQFEEIEPFLNPIIVQAATEVAREREIVVSAEIPRLNGETDLAYEIRKKEVQAGRERFQESEEEQKYRMLEIEAANQLLAQQLSGVSVAPTRTIIYTGQTGGMDRMTESLEKMKHGQKQE